MRQRCLPLGASPLAIRLPDASSCTERICTENRSIYTAESLPPENFPRSRPTRRKFGSKISRCYKYFHHDPYREEEKIKMEETGTKKDVRVLLVQVRTYLHSRLDFPPLIYSRLENTTCHERPSSYSQFNGLTRKCSIVCLPMYDTHPPTPPLRRSSLPYIRRGALYLFSNPLPPLPAFRISQRDSYYFQYLVSLRSNIESEEFKSPIWSLLLQISHFEPSLRHLVLATAMIHQSKHVNICMNYSSIIAELHNSAYKHCSKAVRLLTQRLSDIKGKADTVTWELSFMTCYLFTEFQSILGNEKGAHIWLRKGFRLLKGAFSFYGSDPDGRGLPFRIRETALAFSRLNFSDVVL